MAEKAQADSVQRRQAFFVWCFFKLRDDAIKYKSVEPFDWKVKRINDIIAKDRNGRTLSKIIDGFRVNNEIRNDMCEFGDLTHVIEGMTDENGNQLISYF